MRDRHSSALSSGQGRGIDSSYLSGDDSTAEHVDSGALHHGQYTPELSADTPSHVPSSYASPDPPNIIRPSENHVELRLRVVDVVFVDLPSVEAVDMIWFVFDGFGYMQQNSAEKKTRSTEGLPREKTDVPRDY
ncbi:hypothetical protein Dimus_013797 [Dionaea muscipula]